MVGGRSSLGQGIVFASFQRTCAALGASAGAGNGGSASAGDVSGSLGAAGCVGHDDEAAAATPLAWLEAVAGFATELRPTGDLDRSRLSLGCGIACCTEPGIKASKCYP